MDSFMTPALYGTWAALIPPVIAIVLALITKEVYSALFLGIVVGALLYSGGNPIGAINTSSAFCMKRCPVTSAFSCS